MIDYDLSKLNSSEVFENISRDLLQRELTITFESFKNGADQGIDFRHMISKDKAIIVQAKKYRDIDQVINAFKYCELPKVRKLKPYRYIITTSAELKPEDKDKILSKFEDFIEKPGDIFSQKDLNNLLGKYPDIERKYPELWLTSTNILERILHGKVYNQSEFEWEEIKEQAELYVHNESFDKALEILEKHRYLIISGIPGIGKTTLARMIVNYLLSRDKDIDFIFLREIDDGYNPFIPEKKQIFFFDDFLGSNFLKNKLHSGDDSRIVSFIKRIKKSRNKYLICTTREYTLNQAKYEYETIGNFDIEVAKCILDLSSYTNIIKAKILRNHLYHARVPLTHITNFIESESYLKLVRHQNYNPRIIETFVNFVNWEEYSPNQFTEDLISFFDNPEKVWIHAYENTLNKFSQSSLLVLLTMGNRALLDDWEKATKEYFKINHSESFDSRKFNKTIKELENTFIKIWIDSNGKTAIRYQNPSIQDFLVNFLKDNSSKIENLLKSIIFINQFFEVFTTKNSLSSKLDKILLDEELTNIAINRLINKYPEWKSSRINLGQFKGKYEFSEPVEIWYETCNDYELLFDIQSEFCGKNSAPIEEVLHKEFQKRIYFDDT
ncbi:hypothetical protein KY334_02655, partial [Candidatus Woesearchaeota archaeon]|nr:hypothetical protein [Candidatus Woesearchaeota archaeon]